MDPASQPSPPLPNNDLQSDPLPVQERPQQPFSQNTVPPAGSKRPLIYILFAILLLGGLGFAAWMLFAEKDTTTPNQNLGNTSNQTAEAAADLSDCVFVPKKNFKENEGLYGIWRENAKKVNFDVYLPCEFDKNYNLHELGISEGDDNEVMNVFLTFNRPEPESGEDGLPDDSNFHIRALPEQYQPSNCIDELSVISKEIQTTSCTKVGDSKIGPVYQSTSGDLYIAIGKGLIIWSTPPYGEDEDIKPMMDIINSMQKVDPAKLEFFNG